MSIIDEICDHMSNHKKVSGFAPAVIFVNSDTLEEILASDSPKCFIRMSDRSVRVFDTPIVAIKNQVERFMV